MSIICLNTLIGPPASGKSTYCRKLQSEAKSFNVIHICYDDFIKMPAVDESASIKSFYFETKQYKKQRFSMIWLIQQMIEDIKGKTALTKFKQVLYNEFPNAKFNIQIKSTIENYLLLIDDTMHYKSMRKEIRNVARNHGIGYFITYFNSTIDKAILRNRSRLDAVDDKHLQRMFEICEPPTDECEDIKHVNIDDEDTTIVASVEATALKCIASPLKKVPITNFPVMEQSVVHSVDLILRKSIKSKMEKIKLTTGSIDLTEHAKILCAKRLFLLNEIKMGRVDLPENVDDLGLFLD